MKEMDRYRKIIKLARILLSSRAMDYLRKKVVKKGGTDRAKRAASADKESQ